MSAGELREERDPTAMRTFERAARVDTVATRRSRARGSDAQQVAPKGVDCAPQAMATSLRTAARPGGCPLREEGGDPLQGEGGLETASDRWTVARVAG